MRWSFIKIGAVVVAVGTLVLEVVPFLLYIRQDNASQTLNREKNFTYFLEASQASIERLLNDVLEDVKTIPLMFDSSKELKDQQSNLFFYMMTLFGKNSCIEGVNLILDQGEFPLDVEIVRERSPSGEISYLSNIFYRDKNKTTIYEILYNEKAIEQKKNTYQLNIDDLGSLSTYKMDMTIVDSPILKTFYKKMKENTGIEWSAPITEFFGNEFLLVGCPMRDLKGRFIGAVFARVNFNLFMRSIKKLLPISEYLKFFIMDKKQNIIFYPDNKKIFTHTSLGKRVISKLSSIDDPDVQEAYKIYKKNKIFQNFNKFDPDQKKSFYFVNLSPEFKTDWKLVCIYSQKNQNLLKSYSFEKQVMYIVMLNFLFIAFMVFLVYSLSRFITYTKKSFILIKEGKPIPLFSSYFSEFQEAHQAMRTINRGITLLHRLVPDSFIERIWDRDTFSLVSERQKMAIVHFAEINFFKFANQLTPEQLVQSFSNSAKSFSQIIEQNGGYIDQYMNEALQASYVGETAEASACSGALHCLEYLEKTLNPSFQKMGFDPLDIRFGLSSGHGIVGYVGSESRIEYTVLGACASFAKKSAQLNEKFGTYILIDESIYNQVSHHYIVRPVDRVKSHLDTFLIYDLMGQYGQNNAGIDLGYLAMKTKAAWNVYEAKEWASAQILYQGILDEFPHDLLALHFVKRCTSLVRTPPDKTWDGIVYEV